MLRLMSKEIQVEAWLTLGARTIRYVCPTSLNCHGITGIDPLRIYYGANEEIQDTTMYSDVNLYVAEWLFYPSEGVSRQLSPGSLHDDTEQTTDVKAKLLDPRSVLRSLTDVIPWSW